MGKKKQKVKQNNSETADQSNLEVIINETLTSTAIHSSLRFKAGDRVLCDYFGGWTEGVVCRTNQMESGRLAAYIVKLDSRNEDICVTEDCDESVRVFVPAGIARVIQSIHCGDSTEQFNIILRKSGVDVAVVGQKLLLETAEAGNVNAATCLIKEYHVDLYGAIDKNGRNILQLAVMRNNGQFLTLCLQLQWFDQKMMCWSDEKGFNIFHFLAMSKNIVLVKPRRQLCFDRLQCVRQSRRDTRSTYSLTIHRYPVSLGMGEETACGRHIRGLSETHF